MKGTEMHTPERPKFPNLSDVNLREGDMEVIDRYKWNEYHMSLLSAKVSGHGAKPQKGDSLTGTVTGVQVSSYCDTKGYTIITDVSQLTNSTYVVAGV